jgi:hypothetical protein
MKTLDVEIAIINYFNPRQNIIVPNVSWGIFNSTYKALHECDVLILRKSGYAVEVEIKVSKSDLLADLKKGHAHYHNLIREFYYAVPKELKEIALGSIPENAGLITISREMVTHYKWDEFIGRQAFDVEEDVVRTIRNSKIRTDAEKWSDEKRYQLTRLGTMRILGLKKKIKELQSK